MDEFRRKVAAVGEWGRKARKAMKATARAQLKEETRVAGLTWEQLENESVPLTTELRDRIRELTEGVEVDLNESLEDDDETGKEPA